MGGNKTIKVNVRVLATSNRDLLHFVETGEFRQDLYYRLNVFPVHVAPLRERAEDIIELAEHFLRSFSRKHGIQHAGFTDHAREAMLAYSWPGNVRELQNTIEHAVILTGENLTISCAALGLPVLGQPAAHAVPVAPSDHPPASLPATGQTPDLVVPAAAERHEEAPPGDSTPPIPAEVIPLDEVEKRHGSAQHRRQSHPRGQHARNQHPHTSQQAAGIPRGRRHHPGRRCGR